MLQVVANTLVYIEITTKFISDFSLFIKKNPFRLNTNGGTVNEILWFYITFYHRIITYREIHSTLYIPHLNRRIPGKSILLYIA